MLRSFGLRTKLFSIVFILIFALATVGALGFFGLKQTSSRYEQVATSNLPNTRALGKMRIQILNLVRNVIWFSVSGNTPDEIKHYYQELEKAESEYAAAEKEFLSTPLSESTQKQYDALMISWKKLLEISKATTAALDSAKIEDHQRGMGLLKGEFYRAYHDTFKVVGALLDVQAQEADTRVKESQTIAQRVQTYSMSLTFLASCLGLMAGFFFSQALANTLAGITKVLLGQATSVAAASTQIANAGADLSQAASQQAASVQETVSAVNEIDATITKNSESASQSTKLSAESRQTASDGKSAVQEMIHALEMINDSNAEMTQKVGESNQEIAQIVELIREISNKTKIINDIVFQTKLLSFNASVEAARAGENGKGFAVVAEEVGNLAQMSGNAAKEISALLEGSTQKVEEIVSHTKSKIEAIAKKCEENVRSGSSTAARCGETLDQILQSVDLVAKRVQDIAAASLEQSRGVQEISKAMSQLDQATQQNSMASEESAQAGRKLAEQSVELRSIVRQLEVVVEGDRDQTRLAS
jgi:methyl-accepting chemotaxis protein